MKSIYVLAKNEEYICMMYLAQKNKYV